MSAEEAGGRREFLRSAGRYTALAVLGAVAAITARRKLAGQTCINSGICGGCNAFANCGLPQALSAKQAKARRTG